MRQRAPASVRTTKLIRAAALVSAALLAAAPARPQSRPVTTAPKSQAAALKALPAKGKRYALVVGVDKYADTQVATLGGASNDARLLAEALVAHAGFPAEQVILLASDQPAERHPTRGNILRRLSNLAAVVPKDGLLLFSFAGHGMERGGQAFLLPADAQVSDDATLLEQTAVNVVTVKEWVRKTGVRQVILLLDACRNDPGGRAEADNPLRESYTRGFNFSTRNREVEAFATIYATAIGRRAYEYREKKHGYFTWALVEGLKGAAANDRGEVTLDGLVRHLQERVPKQVRLDLGAGKVQRPFAVIEGYKADELVISLGDSRGLAVVKAPAAAGTESPPASAEAGEEAEREAPSVRLEGTIWEGEGLQGPFTFEFLAGGKIRYTPLFTKRAAGGTWKQIREYVQISIGNYSFLNGKVEAGVIKLKGENAEGEKWDWVLLPKEK